MLVKFLVKAAFLGEPLFRPSRPDFIETYTSLVPSCWARRHCSGLLGRTSLRLFDRGPVERSSQNCSGLLGRTSLRQDVLTNLFEHDVLIVPAF